MSRILCPSRVSHAERYQITATQAQLDAVAASKPVHTGPRYGSLLGEAMAYVRHVHGYGHVKARRTADDMLSDGRPWQSAPAYIRMRGAR